MEIYYLHGRKNNKGGFTMNQKEVKKLHDGRQFLCMTMKSLIFGTRESLNRLREHLRGENDEEVFMQIELLRHSYDKDVAEINRILDGVKPEFKTEVMFFRTIALRLAEDIRGTLMMQYLVPDPAGMYSSSWYTGIQMVTDEDPDTVKFKNAAKDFGRAATEFAYATVGCGLTGGYPERAFYGNEYVLNMLKDLSNAVDVKFDELQAADQGMGERASDAIYEKWGDILNEADINLYKLEAGFAEGKLRIFKAAESKNTNVEKGKEVRHV